MIDTLRHKEVFDYSLYHDKRVAIVGAGAIGSRVFENLASTGFTNITLIDFDKVESHNLANQLYLREDIGESKVAAALSWAIRKCGTHAAAEMTFINNKVDENSVGWFEDADIVISCVDTFDARRLVMYMASQAWADLFIDTRMATTHCVQHMIKVDHTEEVRRWEATLGDDSDTTTYEVSACGSGLSVGATAQTSGAMAAWSVMNYLKTGYVDKVLRVDTSPWLVSRSGG